MTTRAIDCSIIRGGTSKAIFVDGRLLPQDVAERDRLLLALFGSPDVRQIDGLGGADPLTSKLAVVTPSDRPGIDVEFEAAQIGIAEPTVNFGLMCGNTAAGVGYFAIAEGMVSPREPQTVINIYCRNNGKLITATVPVRDGQALAEGDFRIHGVARPGGEELLAFRDPAGAVTGVLLPTGSPCDTLILDGSPIRLSVVDSGTLYAFVVAADLGLSGLESPAALDADTGFRQAVERLRGAIADQVNAVDIPGKRPLAPRKIKIATVAPPADYVALNDAAVTAGAHDVAARIINPEKIHKAFAVSGAISLASAAAIAGSVVHEIVALQVSPATVRIGHPSGILDVGVMFEADAGGCRIVAAEVRRTARILMRGTAYVIV